MSAPLALDPETRAWLEANARFGHRKLAQALGISGAYMSEITSNLGISVRDARIAAGLTVNRIPSDDPPPPPHRWYKETRREPTHDANLAPEEQDREGKIAAQASELRLLSRDLAAVRKRLGQVLDFRQALTDVVRVLPPARASGGRSLIGRRGPRKEVGLVELLGDFHTAEVTRPEETDGWGVYNVAIQEARLGRMIQKVLRYVEVQRHGYRIDRAAVMVVGDLASGDIHRELSITNEAPVPVQVYLAARMLLEHIDALSAAVRETDVWVVGVSNHDRLSEKYQFKEAGYNSIDYLVYTILALALGGRKGVRVHFCPTFKHLAAFMGWRFLLCHGHHIRGWMGMPYYGMVRDAAAEAMRRMQRDRERLRGFAEMQWTLEELLGAITEKGVSFDYILSGHWHVPHHFGKWIVNGSVSGTNELDHARGRVSEPKQTTFLVDPDHGPFNFVDWRLDDPADAALAGVRFQMPDAMAALGDGTALRERNKKQQTENDNIPQRPKA